MKSIVIALIVMCAVAIRPVNAQPNNPYAKNSPPKIELDGKLRAWQGGIMHIVNSVGQPISFALPQTPAGIHFTVPVEKAALKKGMIVRIQAPINANGQFLEPVAALTIITPDRSQLYSKSSMNEVSLNVPGIYRLSDLNRNLPGQPASPDVRVVGAIIGVDQNMLALQCGNKPMQIELNENPKIELSTSSLQYARPGDHVTGSGRMNVATNQLVVSSIKVVGAKPLTADAPPPAIAGATKLRVKERSKSNAKSIEMKEISELTDKPEVAEKPVEPATNDEPVVPKIE